MSLARLLNQPLTLQKVGSGTNSYGDETNIDAGSPIPFTGYLEQSSSIEELVDRNTTVTDWWGYAPADLPVGRRDYINFQAQKFQVDGEPEHCYNPRTRTVSHIRMKLKVVAG